MDKKMDDVLRFAVDWLDKVHHHLNDRERGKSRLADCMCELMELIADKPDFAFEVVLKLIALENSPEFLKIIGAGPLEEIVNLDDKKFKSMAEILAKNDEKLRFALAVVNYGDISE